MFKKLLIIGCGLIGSSLLRASINKKISRQILVFEKSKKYKKQIKSINSKIIILDKLDENISDVDFAILSTPMSEYKKIIPMLNKYIKSDCIITDIGSTKLNVLKIKYEIDKNLVRGLDYYCHTAFEFITDQLGAQGTVLAGGRYDGLSKMLGGVDVAGVGWAAGIERLALMVQSEYINNPDIVLMAQTEVHNHLLLPIMNELVNQGFKAEIIYTGNMSKKFKRANKIND